MAYLFMEPKTYYLFKNRNLLESSLSAEDNRVCFDEVLFYINSYFYFSLTCFYDFTIYFQKNSVHTVILFAFLLGYNKNIIENANYFHAISFCYFSIRHCAVDFTRKTGYKSYFIYVKNDLRHLIFSSLNNLTKLSSPAKVS